ncbi:MAG: PLP-dependent aminotransferase family protein [Candidatus Polarisedimenticolia bacterium]
MIAVELDRRSGVPFYLQIVRQVRSAVETGAVALRDRLPTTRDLARRLGVNRLTVTRAYAELAREGWLDAHVGRGSFVSRPPAPVEVVNGEEAGGGDLAWPSLFARLPGRAVDTASPFGGGGDLRKGTVSFASVFPDPSLFPVEVFRHCLDEVLRKEGHRVLAYGAPGGYAPLREMIAAQLTTRGIKVTRDQVVITSGSQQGIDLVARALLDPGDVVLVENPTYTGAVQVFHSYGAELAGAPLDAEGISLPHVERVLSRRAPKLMYLMPNFQNPTSETMSLSRRRALVRLAASRRLPILEDDFGGDLRFEGPDLPALKALEGGEEVIYMATFAKKLLPGLRVGWIAAPRQVAERLVALKKITDYGTSLLLQAALCEFLRRGEMERHLAHVIEQYRARRDAMLSAMKRCFPGDATWTRPAGGLVVWVTLPPGVDADEVAVSAAARGVLVGRGDLFHVEGGARNNLRLTFSQAGVREIHRGIRLLGDVIHKAMRERRAPAREGAGESLPLI